MKVKMHPVMAKLLYGKDVGFFNLMSSLKKNDKVEFYIDSNKKKKYRGTVLSVPIFDKKESNFDFDLTSNEAPFGNHDVTVTRKLEDACKI